MGNCGSCDDCENEYFEDSDDPNVEQLKTYYRYYVSLLSQIEEEIESENPDPAKIEFLGGLDLKETAIIFQDQMDRQGQYLN